MRPAPPAHRPRKRFGQHFLSDLWAQKVVQAIDPQPGDVFLEIGPGSGAITLPLASMGMPVLAVEIDRDLVGALASRIPSNVTLLTGDFLSTEVMTYLSGLSPLRPPAMAASPRKKIRVVGNVPYNLSSAILFRLIELYRRDGVFADATIMLQREVADRLVAKPGTKAYGVLSISAQVHTTTMRVLDLPPGAFRPPPKVRSTVVRMEFHLPAVRLVDEQLFDRMIRVMFSARRKTLSNALKPFDATAPAVLALAGIDSRRRPETLQLAELARLVELFASVRRPPML
jgi:16S rRNA (adenine1518-N6/adenine1519-N6)-dimethyltransferase